MPSLRLQTFRSFATLSIMMSEDRPPTEFEKKVYDALALVPKGKVTTYGHIARYISCGSPRAIGQALRRNPFAPETPCHRVVSADLTIGGFFGTTKGSPIDRKRRLLEQEGVRFRENGAIDPACCHCYDE
jgi:methylated-DNA-[protein]-cysteine S-methyltransferase